MDLFIAPHKKPRSVWSSGGYENLPTSLRTAVAIHYSDIDGTHLGQAPLGQ